MAAMAGNVISELTHRDTFSAFESEIENQDVLATYIPIRPGDSTGRIEGVLEVYSNITPLLHQVRVVQRNIVLGVSLILAILYALLFLIVQRADGIINRQHYEQLATERELRNQQRTMAMLKERERLARELHDSMGQVLGYVKMQSQVVCDLLTQREYQRTSLLLKQMIESVQLAHVDVRESIMNLQTGVAIEKGFIPMLQEFLGQFEQMSNIRTDLELPEDSQRVHFEPDASAQLIRIVQEVFTNVRKHADASRVSVVLTANGCNGYLAVKDDGCGFDPQQIQTHLGHHVGLAIMQERAREIGGKVQVTSIPGQGSTILITAPLCSKEEEWAVSFR